MVKKPRGKKSYLWDTGALFLFFADHFEAKDLMRKIDFEEAIGYVPQLVLVEFFYKTAEKLGKKLAEYQLSILRDSKNRIIGFDDDQVADIGSIKIKHRTMSIVDCVIGETSLKKNATIITTDGDFKELKGVKSISLEY